MRNYRVSAEFRACWGVMWFTFTKDFWLPYPPFVGLSLDGLLVKDWSFDTSEGAPGNTIASGALDLTPIVVGPSRVSEIDLVKVLRIREKQGWTIRYHGTFSNIQDPEVRTALEEWGGRLHEWPEEKKDDLPDQPAEEN